jgi:hypothetical protein
MKRLTLILALLLAQADDFSNPYNVTRDNDQIFQQQQAEYERKEAQRELEYNTRMLEEVRDAQDRMRHEQNMRDTTNKIIKGMEKNR